MSFARLVKEELTSIKSEPCCKLAEVSALLHLSGAVNISSEGMHVTFESANATIAKRFYVLMKDLYQAKVELVSKRETRLNRKHIVVVNVVTEAERIIEEHGMLESNVDYELLTQKPCCRNAFLRGAFLASGSVNDPIKTNYHLEIFTDEKEEAIFIQKLMNIRDLNAKITRRRNGLIVYLKDAEKIADFLNIIGAYLSVFKYEDIRIKRDFNNSINRVMNCEIANEKKVLDAANAQLRDIKLIEKYISRDKIDDKVWQLMQLRKKHQEASLTELKEKMLKQYNETITRSGINHRFIKIRDMAEKIKNEH